MPRPRIARNVVALTVVSFFTDVSSDMIYPLLPIFLTATLGASASFVGVIEGAAESTSSILKLVSGWWSDRIRRRKPLVVFGYALASAMRPLIGLARSASEVLVIRLGDRVGKGIRNAPRDALIADSIDPASRGWAFGLNRAGDHAGAVLGPLVAFLLLSAFDVSMRAVFLLAVVPGAIAVLVVVLGVREKTVLVSNERLETSAHDRSPLTAHLPPAFWRALVVIFVFTLGNSTDAFLLLRASQLGVPLAMVPVLWALLNVVKALASTPGGALSDRIGRKPALTAGWLLYAAVYIGFAFATETWHAWALFAVYGIFFGLTEGTERALVADLVSPTRRGSAYGWYHLAIGLGVLPASILFGVVWDHAGPPAAFLLGASLAIVATLGLWALGERGSYGLSGSVR